MYRIVIAVIKEDTARKDVKDVLRCKNAIEKALLNKNWSVKTLYLEEKDFESSESIKTRIMELKPFCIFNLFEGFENDSQKEAAFVQIIEDMNVFFTGNSSYTLNLCGNKWKTKDVLRRNNIPTPKGIFVKEVKDLDLKSIHLPIFIKPCFEDASLGIDIDSLVTDEENLHKVIEQKLKEFPKGLMAEEFISGKEYNVGFLGDFPYEAIGISTIDYSEYRNTYSFLTYNSKWETDTCEFKTLLPSLEKGLDNDLKKKILELSAKAGEILGCKSYFRVDLREKNGQLYVLDVNPNPDINEDSGFMKQAYFKGYIYEEVIERIVELAGVSLLEKCL